MGDAMRVFILTVLLLVSGAIGMATCTASVPPPLPQYLPGEQSMVLVRMEKGICTGVVVGKYTIMTATHCFRGGDLKEVDNKPVTIKRIVSDGRDHSLIWLTTELTGKRIAPLGRMPGPGSEVYLWGNPAVFRNLLRVGRVSGIVGVDLGRKLKVPFYTAVIDINIWHGDSGGAYFDQSGRVVGLAWAIYSDQKTILGPMWHVALAQPIEFSHDHIREIE